MTTPREREGPSRTPTATPHVQPSPTYDRRGRARDGAAAPREAFDPLTVPLEPGIALVEASAGTGKTFCITLAVVRLLLDRDASGTYRVGHGDPAAVGRILVVTFTNAATDELVTRVRAVLRDAVDVFAGVLTDRTDRKLQGLFALLDRYGAGELPRLRDALRSLDRLSIFTIHGFCKRVLEESALESGTPCDARFLDDEALLVDRVAQDWWRRTVYEDARLAALAVRDGWSYDAFLADLRAWRRFPDTRLDPDEDLRIALARLDAAVAAFHRVWDPEHAAQFFAARKWLAGSALKDEAGQRRMVDAGNALAAGDWVGGYAFVQHCTSGALVEQCFKKPELLRAAIPDERFVQACDGVVEALQSVRCALRVSCLREVDARFAAEKRGRHLLGFDDLLCELRDALLREGPEGHLATAIRRRYDAALIDEFQDTDSYQFPIFSTAFEGRPLFLIGDPKQAIYGFRGADVRAYLRATQAAERAYTLTTNWRSTPAMIGAVNALFGRRVRPFLHDGIGFLPAHAARTREDPLGHDDRGALHWLFVPPSVDANGNPVAVGKGDAEWRLHRAVAREIVRLVAEGPLAPGRIAVLVRTSYEGLAVQQALRAVHVPCVVSGMGDILQSDELRELEWVMRAVASPRQGRLVRAALATELWGMDARGIHRLAQPEHEPEWHALADRLEAARDAWARHGFMRMVQELVAEQGMPERLLALPDGERRLTNLRHAIELLHTVAVEERLSPEGLLLWVARARSRPSEDAERTELRLESDADAVQIVTVHRSKGLEYDVVFCPGLWAARRPDETQPVLVHEDGGTVMDHGSPLLGQRVRLADAERLAEDLRLAYVALTRARFRCYVGWGAIANRTSGTGASHSALGWLLRDGEGTGVSLPEVTQSVAEAMQATMGQWRATLDALVAGSGGTMTAETVGDEDEPLTPWTGAATAAIRPRVRELVFAADQMRSWRIASFTSLTSPSLSGGERAIEDARDVGDHGLIVPTPRAERRDDFVDFPAGRHAGIVLHELFERLDFGASPADVRALAAELLLRERLATHADDARIDATAAMATRVLAAPMPGAGFALRDVLARATLREWKFHLPLGDVDGRLLADLFAAHGGDRARRYAPALRHLAPARTRGFLTGVLDLAFQHDGRWHVADWKSNHLGAEPEHYDGEGLEREMVASHYVLQYHLYVTALHRFLALRQPGYDYERHMGGAWYVFLRGVACTERSERDGTARGWFHDRPPVALVEALSALMDGGRA